MNPVRRGSDAASRRWAFAACAVLCLALVVLVSFAQVAHIHSTATDQDHCPLCIVLHSAVPMATAVAVLLLMQIAERTPVFEQRAIPLLWRIQLFTRPPPFLR
ncbi:MAG: hypothetical protein KGL64_08890 [Acidobacteriota bacterium]|nr:hypothetical protein [Acidobacteriota bacterium]